MADAEHDDMVRPVPGMRFLHARQITRDSGAAQPVPEPCTITRVACGTVYYRNSRGFLSRASEETFGALVRSWLCRHCGQPVRISEVFMSGRLAWVHDPGFYVRCIAGGERPGTSAEITS